MWRCEYCGRENDESSVACENCGSFRADDIGDSGDNRDSEDLFLDDEGIQTVKRALRGPLEENEINPKKQVALTSIV